MAYGESNGYVTDDTSRRPERSNSWPHYAYISKTRKWLEIILHSKGPPIGNGLWGIKQSPARWRHLTPKAQTR